MAVGALETERDLERFVENLLEGRRVLPKDVAPGVSVPVGAILAYGGATPPAGYLLADGASVLRSDYPELFAAYGTVHGAADSAHFNLPDLTGRVPAMPGGSIAGLGNVGGAATHTLGLAEIPSHTHNRNMVAGGSQTNSAGPDGFMWHDTAGAYNTGASGGGGAHNNLQPYTALNFIVKAAP